MPRLRLLRANPVSRINPVVPCLLWRLQPPRAAARWKLLHGDSDQRLTPRRRGNSDPRRQVLNGILVSERA
jgi:hypothetical protein